MLGGETQSRSGYTRAEGLRIYSACPADGPAERWTCFPSSELSWEISFPLGTPADTFGIPFLPPLKFSSFSGVLKKEEVQMFQESLL